MDNDIKTLERIINFTTKRHGVLSSNIANVDTPGYKTKDLDFDYLINKDSFGLKVTNERHISPNEKDRVKDIKLNTLPSWGDSNNVELDMEIAKMTENAMMFMGSATMLSIKFRMYKEALTRR
jgi:flagellar basal-body rod protein FlgB